MRLLLNISNYLTSPNNTFQLDSLTKQNRKQNKTKTFQKLLKIPEAHFLVFYNVIKAVFMYTDISNTILQSLQYLQMFHTKSYVKK